MTCTSDVGPAGQPGKTVVSQGVLLVNFAIQTAVAFDVENCEFIRIGKVDQITFIWNTLLMACAPIMCSRSVPATM